MNPSEVSERPEESAVEESRPELSVLPSPLNPSWLRLAYAIEFFIALIAIISLWSEIGGEGHLDLMPWFVKLGCILGLAWCCVRFTAGIVEQQRFWTPRSVRWFVGILLFCFVMGGITYYYHLHEELDDGDDDTTAAAANIGKLGIFFYHASTRTWPAFPIRFVAHSAISARD